MRVKAIRKGFYERIRQPGERFEMPVNKCPSWCIELDKVKSAKSKDLKVSDIDPYVATLKTADEVKKFMEGDDRKGAIEACEARIEQILTEED